MQVDIITTRQNIQGLHPEVARLNRLLTCHEETNSNLIEQVAALQSYNSDLLAQLQAIQAQLRTQPAIQSRYEWWSGQLLQALMQLSAGQVQEQARSKPPTKSRVAGGKARGRQGLPARSDLEDLIGKFFYPDGRARL